MELKNHVFKEIHGYNPDKPFIVCTNGMRFNLAEDDDDDDYFHDLNEQSEAEMREEAEYYNESLRG